MYSKTSIQTGNWIKSTTGYQYFLPENIFTITEAIITHLPASITAQVEKSSLALGNFSSLIKRIPSPTQFIMAYINKEAMQSSRIEGTQTTLEDAFKKAVNVTENRDDWEELNAYITATNTATKQLTKLPLCNRVIRDAHHCLLNQVRGKNKLPGEFRHSQNWIGGNNLQNAHFVPPSEIHVLDLMSQLEKYIQDDSIMLSHLIKVALIHYQFETIHPFLDGNGRIGRMLVPLYLLEKKVIEQPILYISDFFEAHRTSYYHYLNIGRNNLSGLIKWIAFFLTAVEKTALNGIQVTENLLSYQNYLKGEIIPNALGRRTEKGLQLLDLLFSEVFIDASDIQEHLGFSAQISQQLLTNFTELKILTEITGQKRNRIFMFKEYLKILSESDISYEN